MPPTKKTGWPVRTKASDKADATTRNVRAINESDIRKREDKTARLKQARLEKEAADAAEAAKAADGEKAGK
ncbi:hypothetical protein FKB34_09170 [Glycocaulis profundi]|nr:hypothetical protein FKB34_09170 [Glycocaulis profundi]